MPLYSVATSKIEDICWGGCNSRRIYYNYRHIFLLTTFINNLVGVAAIARSQIFLSLTKYIFKNINIYST